MCLLSVSCMAQKGFLKLHQDSRIDLLVMKQRQIYANDNTIDGFRVQIFMELGNDAVRHADSVKAVFEEKYPDVPIYLIFGQPYYRLRVGDFRTRLEAENQYQQLKGEYGNSFVTADRINLPNNPLYGDLADLPEEVSVEENDFILDTLKFSSERRGRGKTDKVEKDTILDTLEKGSIIKIEENLNYMNWIYYEDD